MHSIAELKELLLRSDTGPKTTHDIIERIQQRATTGKELKEVLHAHLIEILSKHTYKLPDGPVYLLVGINGSGKTTVVSKLTRAHRNKKVLVAAADTFRAAAPEQLAALAEKSGADIIKGTAGEDPSSVIFKAAQRYKEGSYDILIIDTAGRLQTKSNLMQELAKIRQVLTKQLPHTQITTLLTIDSMLGQNSLSQVQLFHESTPLDGVVLTKMDGTAKGGVIFSLTLPIAYISYGESPDAWAPFQATTYVDKLLAP